MRKVAREIVFKMVFGYLFTKDKEETLRDELIKEKAFELTKEDKEYIEHTYSGIAENIKELNKEIEENTTGYTVKRIYKTDMAILLLALYEIKNVEDVPTKVAMNEAIDLAKKFGEEKSPKFINGVLAKVVNVVNED